MRAELPAEVVQRSYQSGVDEFVAHGRSLSRAEWDRPACGKWSAGDLARHVLAVARWYHHWLDRAEAGETARPFPAAEMAERNDREIAKLAALPPSDATEQFATVAGDYLLRVSERWDLTYPFPFGVVSAGQHAALGAAEWHLHTWDLSQGRHLPESPEALFLATGSAFAAARGGLPGAALGQMVPLAARRKPWEAMLKKAGRKP